MLWLTMIPIKSFMAHPETLLPMPTIDDPLERFVSVVKFYLSGWHIKPPYVRSTCSYSVLRRRDILSNMDTAEA
jgi:hypothetical protein